MKKHLLSLGFIGFCILANAQVGIGTTTPNASLDVVKSTTNPTTTKDGIIPPNVSKLELASKVANTYSTLQTGAIVYVATINEVTTEPSVAQVANITTVGYYYFDGTVWQKMSATAGGDSTNDAWVNNPASTRVELGTTSTGIARTLGSEVVVTDAGRLGIGTGTDVPDAGLHIIGDNDGWKDDIRLDSYSGNATPGANFRFYGARGTKATPLSVIAGDVLGQMNFWYHNGTNFPGSGARITSIYRSTAGADLSFSTGGSTNSSMVITDAGRVGIGTSTPASTLEVKKAVTSSSDTTNPVASVDGLIPPNMSKLELARKTFSPKTYDTAQTGAMVYVNNVTDVVPTSSASYTQIPNVTAVGYYVFDGTIWQPASGAVKVIRGNFGSGITVYPYTFNNNQTTKLNTGAYIDLPPGKWDVRVNILIKAINTNPLYSEANRWVWSKFTFYPATSATANWTYTGASWAAQNPDVGATSAPTNFLVAGTYTSAGSTSAITPSTDNYMFSMNYGNITINNTDYTNSVKRYYLFYYANAVNNLPTTTAARANYQFDSVANAAGENSIVATRITD